MLFRERPLDISCFSRVLKALALQRQWMPVHTAPGWQLGTVVQVAPEAQDWFSVHTAPAWQFIVPVQVAPEAQD